MKNSIPTFLSSPERFIQIEGTFFTIATFCYSAFRGNLVITNVRLILGMIITTQSETTLAYYKTYDFFRHLSRTGEQYGCSLRC